MQEPGQRHFLDAADRLAVAQHRQLRDAAGLHQLDGLGGRRVRADGHECPRPSSPQQVADGLRRRARSDRSWFSASQASSKNLLR